MAIYLETGQRIRAYPGAAGHSDDRDGHALPTDESWPASTTHPPTAVPRLRGPDVAEIWQAAQTGHCDLAHSMRATFITTALENGTTALENGAKLEDVQRTMGHADPSTTQLYDRRRFMPTKSAALVVDYGNLRKVGVRDEEPA